MESLKIKTKTISTSSCVWTAWIKSLFHKSYKMRDNIKQELYPQIFCDVPVVEIPFRSKVHGAVAFNGFLWNQWAILFTSYFTFAKQICENDKAIINLLLAPLYKPIFFKWFIHKWKINRRILKNLPAFCTFKYYIFILNVFKMILTN